jgi:hypothetical protein
MFVIGLYLFLSRSGEQQHAPSPTGSPIGALLIGFVLDEKPNFTAGTTASLKRTPYLLLPKNYITLAACNQLYYITSN